MGEGSQRKDWWPDDPPEGKAGRMEEGEAGRLEVRMLPAAGVGMTGR